MFRPLGMKLSPAGTHLLIAERDRFMAARLAEEMPVPS
jgi:pheromone shutdown protein TraB